MPNQNGINDHNGEKAVTIAAGYDAVDRRQAFPQLYALLDKAAEDGRHLKILNIGAGAGHDDIKMAAAGHKVVAVEPSDLREIAICERSHPNIDYRDGMLPKLDSVKPDEKFDAVLLLAVWQYVDPAERVESLVRIAQTLEPNGKLVLAYPSPPSRVFQYEISPETLKADIDAANALLPKSQKLSISGEPVITPDPRGRKSLDGRELNFYSFTLETGHAQSLGSRDGRAKA
jgi:SAM-dependent methyltransferase